jgi:hypothetical protein
MRPRSVSVVARLGGTETVQCAGGFIGSAKNRRHPAAQQFGILCRCLGAEPTIGHRMSILHGRVESSHGRLLQREGGSVGSVRIHHVELAEIGISCVHSPQYIHTVQNSHVEVSPLYVKQALDRVLGSY